MPQNMTLIPMQDSIAAIIVTCHLRKSLAKDCHLFPIQSHGQSSHRVSHTRWSSFVTMTRMSQEEEEAQEEEEERQAVCFPISKR